MVRCYPWVRSHRILHAFQPSLISLSTPARRDHVRRPREEYVKTILSPNSWGGAIELAILAAYYHTEIASIDVETGRIDRFGDLDGARDDRALLIYSGIHYDAAVLAPEPGAPQEFSMSLMPSIGEDGERVLDALRALATKLRAKGAYTNTATFDLKCEVPYRDDSILAYTAPLRMLLAAVRCAGRGSKARRGRVRMRRRRDTSSLANSRISDILYSNGTV